MTLSMRPSLSIVSSDSLGGTPPGYSSGGFKDAYAKAGWEGVGRELDPGAPDPYDRLARVAGEESVYRQNLPIYSESRYPIMHGDYHSRANLFYSPAEVIELYCRRTPDQGQQDVHSTSKPIQLLGGERVACIPHVEEADSP